MSLYIKGIDMPKDRETLTIEIDYKGEVTAYSTELKELECTPIAIEIPTPHGRLIDGDIVADMLDSMMVHKTLNNAFDEVLNMPTILVEEKE